ncbi:MAG: hypothetical protein JAY74_23055 [Candidatus Thiodiazotropha taylori]|nr:hypothetical protein [Candidatus Thiodiazotropha taylori]
MITKKAIEEVSACPDQFLSPVFLVPKKDGGQRPVINLKKLNQYVEYQHFKLEGIQALKSLIKKGDFMVKLDLSDAYFGVPILKSHRKYLRFFWRGKIFEFQALPFGLGVGPRYYTKLLKPVIAFLRRIGVRIIIYLDDMILLNQSSQMLLRDLTSLRWLLENLGFIINWKKSVWAPTQEIQFLGFLIDSVNMIIRLPSEKIQKIIQKCQRLVSKKVTRVRKISEILGLMTSSLQAIAPAPLHYRNLQMTQIRGLLINKSYQAKVSLNTECLQELRWWISQMRSWNGKSIISAGPDLTLTSDASKKGWGAALGTKRAQGLWTREETGLHINVLELKGALFALRTFAQDLREIHIHMKMDNRTAVAYIQKMGGTRSARMLPVTQEIWKFALDREIVLSAEYLPGSLNTEADWQSRNFQDSSDWQLKKCVFQQLNSWWGPFKLDLFASRHNTQLEQYVSWYPDPYAQAVDAFQQPWKMEGLYLFPPFAMIPRCLMKVQQDKISVVLIAPPWQTQPWFPSLLSMLGESPSLLPPYKDLLSSPNGQVHPLAHQQRFRLVAWRISGNETLTKGFQSKLPSCSQHIHGGKAHPPLTTAVGDSGVAGVMGDKWIHFVPLW